MSKLLIKSHLKSAIIYSNELIINFSTYAVNSSYNDWKFVSLASIVYFIKNWSVKMSNMPYFLAIYLLNITSKCEFETSVLKYTKLYNYW